MDLSKLSISELRELRTNVNQWIDHRGIILKQLKQLKIKGYEFKK